MSDRIEKRYEFKKRLLSAGFPIEWTEKKDKGMISFATGVEFKGGGGKPLVYAEKHFSEFLKAAFGINNRAAGKKTVIEFISDKSALGEYFRYKGRIITADEQGVTINAYDERGAAAAVYDIEKMLAAKNAPYLKKGVYKNAPLFSPRMVHSAYGLEEYPEKYMVNLVKEGIDAIVVFVKDVNRTQLGRKDFNALIKRAKNIGLDVYAYCMLNNFNSPAAPDAEKIFDGIYGRFFRAHSGFKGLVLVGESVEFPSRDEHVACRHYYETGEENIPDGKPSPGWWPCKDYPEWLNLVVKSVRKVKPDADIVFWTYNWGYAPEADRIALINSLPENISLQVTYEMFEKYHIGNVEEMVCDYSIAFPGPGRYFLSEAEAAKKRGIRLYTMCNAGGRTWDFGVLPYLPALELWKERYEGLLDAHEKYGLTGLMECHHFGYTPSFLTRFAGYMFEKSQSTVYGEKDTEEKIYCALVEFFGKNARTVRKALKKLSDAMRIFPPTDEMQYGPMRICTAYPFNLIKKLSPPEKEKVSFGLSICNIMFEPWDFGRYMPQSLRLEGEIKLFAEIMNKTDSAIRALECASHGNEEFFRLVNLLKFMRCSFETARNTLIFYKWKLKLFSADTETKLKTAVSEIRRVAARERENALSSIEYVEKDSGIGFEPSMGYVCDKERILWKIKQLDYMTENELEKYARQ